MSIEQSFLNGFSTALLSRVEGIAEATGPCRIAVAVD